LCQKVVEPLPGTGKAAFHRILRQAQDGDGLLYREALQVKEQQRYAVFRVQMIQRNA
jgi:hypothetical protein